MYASSYTTGQPGHVDRLLASGQYHRTVGTTAAAVLWHGLRTPPQTQSQPKSPTMNSIPRMRRGITYEAPSEDLLEALHVLMRYLTVVEDPGDPDSAAKPAQQLHAAWLPLAPLFTPITPAHSMRSTASPSGPPSGPPRLGAAGGLPLPFSARHARGLLTATIIPS